MVNRKGSATLYEQVVKEIENKIMAGVYRKGELLPSEKELMDILGVSRITVRKALGILSKAGLIETCHGRGSVVRFDISSLAGNGSLADYAQGYVRSFRSVAQIRCMVEPEIAREVALHATEDQIRQLEACLTVSNKNAAFQKEEFHRKMVEFLENDALLDFYDHLIDLESRKAPEGVVSPERQHDISLKLDQQHHEILNAIQRHDGEFAYFYMKEHARFVSDTFETYFKYLF